MWLGRKDPYPGAETWFDQKGVQYRLRPLRFCLPSEGEPFRERKVGLPKFPIWVT